LAPIGYASRKLNSAECNNPIYERKCLAVLFGCEKFRSFLEHNDFVVHTDSEALSWLRKHPRQLGRVGGWVLRLAPFKFQIVHIPIKSNLVANCLSRVFSDQSESSESSPNSINLLSQIPASFESLIHHQKQDSTCQEIYLKMSVRDTSVRNFILDRGLIVYRPTRARRGWVYVPEAMRAMICHYFHDTTLGVHLGVTRTLHKITWQFY
jgi:hypothetical protein